MIEPRTYRKRSVVVEAVQVDDTNGADVAAWIEAGGGKVWRLPRFVLAIDTPEGIMRAEFGDWVIREPYPTDDRRFYCCKAAIFANHFDPVPSEVTAS